MPWGPALWTAAPCACQALLKRWLSWLMTPFNVELRQVDAPSISACVADYTELGMSTHGVALIHHHSQQGVQLVTKVVQQDMQLFVSCNYNGYLM